MRKSERPFSGIEGSLKIKMSPVSIKSNSAIDVAVKCLESLVFIGAVTHNFMNIDDENMEILGPEGVLWSLREDGVSGSGIEKIKSSLLRVYIDQKKNDADKAFSRVAGKLNDATQMGHQQSIPGDDIHHSVIKPS